MERRIESRIEDVHVYARGAVVVRQAVVTEMGAAGPVDVRIGQITAAAEPASFRVTAKGGRELVAARSVLVVPEAPAGPGEALQRLRALHRDAHLRATATLQGGPLLAGPVRVARDQSLVGLSKIGYVGTGEPFEIGLGTDDAVRVRRTQKEERSTSPVVGTQKLHRTVTVYLSNLSGEPRSVEVTERVPVSEIEDVEVSPPGAPWRFDGKDGFARKTVDLAPHATESLELSYEVRASAKVRMPF